MIEVNEVTRLRIESFERARRAFLADRSEQNAKALYRVARRLTESGLDFKQIETLRIAHLAGMLT